MTPTTLFSTLPLRSRYYCGDVSVADPPVHEVGRKEFAVRDLPGCKEVEMFPIARRAALLTLVIGVVLAGCGDDSTDLALPEVQVPGDLADGLHDGAGGFRLADGQRDRPGWGCAHVRVDIRAWFPNVGQWCPGDLDRTGVYL